MILAKMKNFLNLFIVLSTNLIFNDDKPSIVPLSDQMINFINENDLTWKVLNDLLTTT